MGIFTKSKPEPRVYPRDVDINSLLGGIVDRRCDAIYDRVRLKAESWTPQSIVCFQVPVGCNDPFTGHVRSFVDTNMMRCGQFPAPHDMTVRRFLFLFQPSCSGADRNGWLANYQWDFRILEKNMQRQPLLVSAATGSPENLIQNFGKGSWQDGDGERENDSTSLIHKLGEGVAWDLGKDLLKYVPPLTPFNVELRGNPFRLQCDIDFYVMLHGSRDFPVQ